MRKIEERMVSAILHCRCWCEANTAVFCDGLSHHFAVKLHGNQIAEGQTGMGAGFTVTHATLCGWDTPTTRSRLRALGVDVPALRRAEGYIKPRPKRPWHPSKTVDAYEI